jgi:hypothetical protein
MRTIKDPRVFLNDLAAMPVDEQLKMVSAAFHVVSQQAIMPLMIDSIGKDDEKSLAFVASSLLLQAYIHHKGDFKAAAESYNRTLVKHGITARID